MPGHGAFYRFFGAADEDANVAAYRRFLRDKIDVETRGYWESRDVFGRPRVTLFARGLYRHGLLGRWIGTAHFVAKLYGVDPREFVAAATPAEQRRYFETTLAPLFDKRLVRWATSRTVSLYGLGIPPAQYKALAGVDHMAAVLRARLEKLACGFSLSENYFAWQPSRAPTLGKPPARCRPI
jgi:S-adenosylmethionine-diacylglycerol 3-amino-3-carboxypropyl transferase